MARIDEVTQALVDLGLTKTEAEVYTELLRLTVDGPVSGYKVAQTMGRDPANMSKTLMGLEARGAVRIEQDKPRLFQPVPPSEFTEQQVHRISAQRRKAVELLAGIGGRITGDRAYSFRQRAQVLDHCRRLLAECRNIALLDCTADMLEVLCVDLEAAIDARGVAVMIRCPVPSQVTGARIVVEPGETTPSDTAYDRCSRIHLVTDGSCLVNAYLTAEGDDPDPASGHGIWSDSPFLAAHGHHSLGAKIMLARLRQLLRQEAPAATIAAAEHELSSLIRLGAGGRDHRRDPDTEPPGDPSAIRTGTVSDEVPRPWKQAEPDQLRQAEAPEVLRFVHRRTTERKPSRE